VHNQEPMIIRLPSLVDPKLLAMQELPGVLLALVGGILSDYWLAPRIAFVFGPFMWLLVTYIFCTSTSWIVEVVARQFIKPHNPHYANYTMICYCYLELFFIGVGAGCAWWHLKDLNEGLHGSTAQQVLFAAEHFGIRWEPGENTACTLIAGSIVLQYVHQVLSIMVQDLIEEEGALLNFKTVRQANCSAASDEERIRSAIYGHETEIDNAIKMLQLVGRYDQSVRDNLVRGMSKQRARDGVFPFKVAAATFAWEFWWITDIAGRGDGYLSLSLPAVSVILAFALVYYLGDRAIHAVDIFALWHRFCSHIKSPLVFHPKSSTRSEHG